MAAGADPEGRPSLSLVPFALDALLTRIEGGGAGEPTAPDTAGGGAGEARGAGGRGGGGGGSVVGGGGGGGVLGGDSDGDGVDGVNHAEAAAAAAAARGAAAGALLRLASEPLGKSALGSRPAAVAGLVSLLSSGPPDAAAAAAATLWVGTIRVAGAADGMASAGHTRTRYCSPRHPTPVEPFLLELFGIL